MNWLSIDNDLSHFIVKKIKYFFGILMVGTC